MEMRVHRVSTPLDERIYRLECHCGCHSTLAALPYCLSCNRYHLVEDRTARSRSPYTMDIPPAVVRVRAGE
jgi:hypothetical protein